MTTIASTTFYNPLDEFTRSEIDLHSTMKCDETTSRICAKNYPDLVAQAKAREAAAFQNNQTA